MVRAPLHFHGRIPVPEVAPLTYRDGVTHLELVYELSQYLKNILHPSLQSTVEQVVADAEQLLSEANAQYVDGVQEFQRIHDAFMSDVNANLIALNDYSMTELVNDDSSMFGGRLRDIFVTDTRFTQYQQSIREEQDEFQESVNTRFTEFADETNTRFTEFADETNTRFTNFETTVNTQLDQFGERVSHVERKYPEYYGAFGDGERDDTAALQAWLDDGWGVFRPGSTYLTTRTLNVTGDHRVVSGNGSQLRIVGDGSYESFALRVHGDESHISGLFIDGARGGKSRGGISVHGDSAHVVNNVVTNMLADRGLMGIHLVSTYGGHTVVANTVTHMHAPSDGVFGDSNGVSRGIYYHVPGSTVNRSTLIASNHVHDIDGIEGDGIQVIMIDSSSSSPVFPDAHTVIDGNMVSDCSRRMIKIQASNVVMKNNVLREHSTELKRHPQPALYVLNAKNVEVQNNDVEFNQHQSGIFVSGASPDYAYRVNVIGNTVRGPQDVKKPCITAARQGFSVIQGNTTYGGYRGISLSGSIQCVVDGNTTHEIPSSDTINNAMAIVMYGDRGMLTNNTDTSRPSGSYTAHRNYTENGVTANNHSLSSV